MSTNEAAERLLHALQDAEGSDPFVRWDTRLRLIKAHDAAERRATVERIRADVHEYMEIANAHGGSLQIDRDDFDTILDEVAAR